MTVKDKITAALMYTSEEAYVARICVTATVCGCTSVDDMFLGSEVCLCPY